jgi:hypothetical protein
MSFSSGDLHDKENRVKWYDKKWFMWCMLIFFWPAGAYLLYRHRNEYSPKKAKLIAAGTGCFWLFMSLTSPKDAPQNSQPPAQEVEMATESASTEVEQPEDKPAEAAQEEQHSETATANDSSAQSAGAAAATTAATATHAVQKAASAGSANVNATYLGNPKSMKFHNPGCRTIKHPERFVSLSSRDEAVASGYKPCRVCNP